MSIRHFAPLLLVAAALGGCDEAAPPAAKPRPVRATTITGQASGETISLTGQIRAQVQTSLAFRIDGRVIERAVHVGDVVKAGQVIARVDSQLQQNALRQAQAALLAAQGQALQARNAFGRQQTLLHDGYTSRANFDQAQQALQTTEAQVAAARAQLHTAEEQRSFTELVADAPGTVTAVGAEPGEVVAPGRMVAEIARDGGLDAVFSIPAQLIRTVSSDIVVDIALTDDARITVKGRVRELAPQADAATRTFAVKVALIDPPPSMRLGATVKGRIVTAAPAGIEIPATALTQADGRAAVWVVDPNVQNVSLRSVDVLRYDERSVVVAQGLQPGETVVTAGTQVLRPGQSVRVLEGGQ
ncbi:efflux RND transporter periplasmic adaptor subunit [Roseiterribacter gracilis]|uniref:RND transporter n=1 Tax=Roseiterribacter gracilis TaxID=2812848 RepID=A0A8S8X7K8_9PROT|nr:RND transporter [Rhodospirillales bacterium TMPK1]